MGYDVAKTFLKPNCGGREGGPNRLVARALASVEPLARDASECTVMCKYVSTLLKPTCFAGVRDAEVSSGRPTSSIKRPQTPSSKDCAGGPHALPASWSCVGGVH